MTRLDATHFTTRSRPVARSLPVAAGRAVLDVVGMASSLAAVLLVGASGVAWRLSNGPVSLDALLHRAALLPSDVAVGNVEFSWPAWRNGADEPVAVSAQDVRAAGLPGVAQFRLNRGDATFALAPLLRGTVAPVSVSARGLDAEIVPAPRESSRRAASLDLSRLRDVDLSDVRLTGSLRGVGWTAQIDRASIGQAEDGAAAGDVTGTVGIGTASTAITGHAARGADGALHVTADTGEFRPAALATVEPRLAGLDVPVTLRVSADLSAALDPIHASVRASVGPGTATAGGHSVHLDEAAGEAALSWQGSALSGAALSGATATVASPSGGAPTTLQLEATASPSADEWHVTGGLTFDQVAATDLKELWPPDVAGNARRWIVENITAGTARAGQVSAAAAVPNGGGQPRLTALTGTMQADDLAVHWLRPVPPVEHVSGTLTVVSPDEIQITPVHGEQPGHMQVRDGAVTIMGLKGGHEEIRIALNVLGPLPELIALLSHPRLKLLSRRPLPFTVAGGAFTAQLDLHFPLLADLPADKVQSTAQARLSNVSLRDVVLGRGLSNGALELDVSNDGMRLEGRGELASIETSVAVTTDFRAGPPTQALATVDATAHVTSEAMQRQGLDTAGTVAGSARLDVHYVRQRSGDERLGLSADMAALEVSTPLWHKLGGTPAQARAAIELHDNHLVSISELHAEGPGLLLSGRAEAQEGRPAAILLDRIVLDRTDASGEIRLPSACAGALCVRLSGPTLDLSGGLGHIMNAPHGKGTAASSLPWRADARFDRILLDEGRDIGPVRADGRSDGKRLVSATLDAPGVQASLREQGHARVVAVRAQDLGTVLRSIGTTDILHGGEFRLDGRFNDAQKGSPLTARAELNNFTIQRAVAAGKILQSLTLFGIVDAIRGPGLFFSRAVVPLTYVGDLLTLREARASSASLGVTADGWLDLSRSTLGVHGTIVPAYAVNSALGRLPLVGPLFSPEKGGGVIAADFMLTGPLDDPNVTVNPLSALTPGFLRGIFDLFH